MCKDVSNYSDTFMGLYCQYCGLPLSEGDHRRCKEDYNPCIGCSLNCLLFSIRRNCKGCEFSKGGQDFDNDNDNIYNS